MVLFTKPLLYTNYFPAAANYHMTHAVEGKKMEELTYEKLASMKPSELDQVLENGTAPSLESIAGYEFRGYNVLPGPAHFVMWLLSNVRFIKCFFQKEGDPPISEAEHIHGYNLKVKRGGLNEPWTCNPGDEKPDRIGHYRVHPKRHREPFDEYPHAVFLDYNLPVNNFFTGKTIEDYLVKVSPGNEDLLLGKAYFRAGFIRSPSFFILERLQRHER